MKRQHVPADGRRERRIAPSIVVASLVASLTLVGLILLWLFALRVDETPPTVAGSDMRTLKVALLSYRHHIGRLPTTQEGLDALVSRPASAPENWQRII